MRRARTRLHGTARDGSTPLHTHVQCPARHRRARARDGRARREPGAARREPGAARQPGRHVTILKTGPAPAWESCLGHATGGALAREGAGWARRCRVAELAGAAASPGGEGRPRPRAGCSSRRRTRWPRGSSRRRPWRAQTHGRGPDRRRGGGAAGAERGAPAHFLARSEAVCLKRAAWPRRTAQRARRLRSSIDSWSGRRRAGGG